MAANKYKRATNLKKSELGGVIFGCTKHTMGECLSSQLFGLPGWHFIYVQNIEPGLPLFLFCYSDKKLHGIFEAATPGRWNINPYAWTNGGSKKTDYPAQVQVRVRLQCQPLSEDQFKPIIANNYYSHNHFRFELDHVQASKLITTFSSLTVDPGSWTPKNPKKLAANDNLEEIGPSNPTHPDGDIANANDPIGTSADSDVSESCDRNQLKEESPCDQVQQPDEEDIKFKEHASSDVNILECMELAAADGPNLVPETHCKTTITSGKGKDESSFGSIHYPAFISQLREEIEELKAFKQEHTLKVATLEKGLVEAKQQINQLENRCMVLESTTNPLTTLAGDKACESPELNLNLDQSIFLVGGCDGISYSSALDCFSPAHDVLRSLKPMSSVRAHASVANLGGEICVLGGESDLKWCDTVESYNVVNNQWTMHPPLKKEKGSLAVAALDGKLFAVGGGNGVECFSDVEMFDPVIGRWISTRSMLQKRFSLAAVECHGVIYAIGGYDGRNYLKSGERYDRREDSWSSISDMDTKRGSHSLVVLNDKLYAIGGNDGVNMVPSVEIYDPRMDRWMSGEAMTQGRGYSATALVNDSIFVIGGIVESGSITDLIEFYREGQGWQPTNSRAVRNRCYASAIVLQE